MSDDADRSHPAGEVGDASGEPRAGMLKRIFEVAEIHDVDDHHLRVLKPATADWLDVTAGEYRKLRTYSTFPATPLSFDGVNILDVDGVESLLAKSCVPEYRTGNFGVARSDLAEVILGMVLESDYGCRYGYRSVRDRETRQLPGRGIDQIGIEFEPSFMGLTLVLGEAKVSSENASPPRVVDASKDCLRVQHLGHLDERGATVAKVVEASKNADDMQVQLALRLAAVLFERSDSRLRVVAASVMVRPENSTAPSDFGTFHSSVSDFAPADVRFLIVRLSGDIDKIAEDFATRARSAEGAAA